MYFWSSLTAAYSYEKKCESHSTTSATVSVCEIFYYFFILFLGLLNFCGNVVVGPEKSVNKAEVERERREGEGKEKEKVGGMGEAALTESSMGGGQK